MFKIAGVPFLSHSEYYFHLRVFNSLLSIIFGFWLYCAIFMLTEYANMLTEYAKPTRDWILKIKKEIEHKESKLRKTNEDRLSEKFKGTNLKVVKSLSEIE